MKIMYLKITPAPKVIIVSFTTSMEVNNNGMYTYIYICINTDLGLVALQYIFEVIHKGFDVHRCEKYFVRVHI